MAAMNVHEVVKLAIDNGGLTPIKSGKAFGVRVTGIDFTNCSEEPYTMILNITTPVESYRMPSDSEFAQIAQTATEKPQTTDIPPCFDAVINAVFDGNMLIP